MKKLSWFSSVLVTLLMALPVSFFGFLRFDGWNRTGGLIVCLWYLTLFFLILKTGDVSRWRRIFFVTVALLFFPSFIMNLLETRGHMTLTAADVAAAETPFCHIAIPQVLLPAVLTGKIIFSGRLTGHYASILSMLVIWLVASLTLGRGWCSWVCFYGGWDDGFSRLAKKVRLPVDPSNRVLRAFPYAMLAFAALGSLATLSAVYCDWLCPFKLITEYETVTGLKSMIAMILFILTFFGLVVILPLLTRRRMQCGAFCPFGAFQSLVGKATAPYAVRLDREACIDCGKCAAVCPTFSITRESVAEGKSPLANCTLCGECVKACPKGALEYRFRKGKTEACASALEREKGWKRIVFGELLNPRTLFVFTAFLFGTIISAGFGADTVGRILKLIFGGH